MSQGRNILVTGPPRIGKSTLLERIIHRVQRPMTGFFTGEIKDNGQRVGFSIATVDGRQGILAHRDLKGRYRVGKYAVNLEDLERIAVPSMIPTARDQLVVIDEIGKMECFSRLFRETVVKALESENDVLGSVSMRGARFIGQIRQRRDVTLVQVTKENRDDLVFKLAQMF